MINVINIPSTDMWRLLLLMTAVVTPPNWSWAL